MALISSPSATFRGEAGRREGTTDLASGRKPKTDQAKTLLSFWNPEDSSDPVSEGKAEELN